MFFGDSDPNSVETLKSFQDCIEWTISGNFNDDDINEAKFGVFSQVKVITLCIPVTLHTHVVG